MSGLMGLRMSQLYDYQCRSCMTTNVGILKATNFTDMTMNVVIYMTANVAGDDEHAAEIFICPVFPDEAIFWDLWVPQNFPTFSNFGAPRYPDFFISPIFLDNMYWAHLN